jgi:8-oxo-dGTP pyrophosphatase MutT (NUDIX family)
MRRPEEVQVFVCRRSGEEFLVLHRSPAHGGYWHPASGALEEGEEAEQAAVRELREEIGLDAAGRLWPVRYEYGYDAAEEPPERRAEWPPGTERIAVTGFVGEAPAEFEPTLNWEHDDYRWCSREEAGALFHWPDVGEALEELWRRAELNSPERRSVFSPDDRARIRERVLTLARDDRRITGGAITGSASVDAEDRWSDIDLSFGVVDDVDPEAVLTEWTTALEQELDILHYWDLRRHATIYRVFLLQGGLELDIAVTPRAEFGARGPKFRLLFGEASEVPAAGPPAVDDVVGLGWLSALTARTAIERGNRWAAEYWISALRDQALALACLRLGEQADYARGFDRLPSEITRPYEPTLVGSLEPRELRRALMLATRAFLQEVAEIAPSLGERLGVALGQLTER